MSAAPLTSVVVTGSGGFVGRYLIEELRIALPNVRVFEWDLPDVDIRDPNTYRDQLASVQPDWIVHLAAIASVRDALEHPERVRRVNVDAARLLFDTVSDMSPQTNILAVSSADIYGLVSSEPVAELPLAQASPRNPYAESKRDMERLIEESYGSRCLRVRPFPHIGPGQKLGFVTADFASQIAAIEAGKQEAVIRVGNLEAKRDFSDVRDVVRAYRLLMEHGVFGASCSEDDVSKGVCGVYHIASGNAVRTRDVLDSLVELADVEVSIETDPDRMRPSDNPVVVGDASKLRAHTGWKPQISFEQSLRDVLDDWRKRV